MITQSNLNVFTTRLLAKLTDLLADDLGQYQVGSATIPSIWMTPPDLPKDYKMGLGVEVILNGEPKQSDGGLMGVVGTFFEFEILLRQWDTSKTLTVPILKIRSCKDFVIHKDVISRPQREINGEIWYAQATISLTVTDLSFYI